MIDFIMVELKKLGLGFVVVAVLLVLALWCLLMNFMSNGLALSDSYSRGCALSVALFGYLAYFLYQRACEC